MKITFPNSIGLCKMWIFLVNIFLLIEWLKVLWKETRIFKNPDLLFSRWTTLFTLVCWLDNKIFGSVLVWFVCLPGIKSEKQPNKHTYTYSIYTKATNDLFSVCKFIKCILSVALHLFFPLNFHHFRFCVLWVCCRSWKIRVQWK